jgi:hypothetical protein
MTRQILRNRKRFIALLSASIGLGFLGIGTATASLLPGGWGDAVPELSLENWQNPLEDVLAQIEQTTTLAEETLQQALGEQWAQLQEWLNAQLPEPFQVREGEVEGSANVLTTDPTAQQQELANLYDQVIARTMAAPWLGEQGQERLTIGAEQTTAVLESSQATVQEVQSMAETAQGLTVTQDVMKQSAQIDAAVAALLHEQTQLTAENQTSLEQLQQLQAMLTQLTANTSAGIDAANRREQIERQISISGSAAAPLYIPGALGTDSAPTD